MADAINRNKEMRLCLSPDSFKQIEEGKDEEGDGAADSDCC